jgi:zinc transport system substrate-binding protein
MYKIIVTSLIIATLWQPTPSIASEVPHVVTTVKPLHSLISGVMKGVGTPTLLLDQNYTPHSFQLKPSHLRTLNRADMIFYIDDNFETFLHKALKNLPDKTQKIMLSNTKNLTLLPIRSGGVWGEGHQHHHDDHGHESHEKETISNDMHLWLSLANARVLIGEIALRLGKNDPTNATTYNKNAAHLTEKTENLQTTFSQMLAPVKAKPFIVFHDAYQYFEQEQHLSAKGAIVFEPDDSASPKRIIAVRKAIKEFKAQCVFSEPGSSARLINTVVEGTNTHHAELDPLGMSLQPGDALYFTLMENLAASLADCLAK